MTGLITAWEGFLFQAVPPYRIAAFRIALGLYLGVYWALHGPQVELYFSDLGVQAPYLFAIAAPSAPVAWFLYGATFVLIAMFTLGARARLVTPLLFVAYAYHYFLAIAIKGSTFERLLIVFLVVLCFADSAQVWSWDARGRTQPRPVLAWPQRLVMTQTLLLYFVAGLWKLANPAWRDGVLLHSTFQGVWATPLAFELVRAVPTLATWAYLSWAVIALELLLAPLFFYERTRTVACVLGLLFHLANCVLLMVPEFLLVPTTYVLFVRTRTLALLRV